MIFTTFYEMKESVKIHNFSAYFKLLVLQSCTSLPYPRLVIQSANGLLMSRSHLFPIPLSPLSQQLKVTILVQSSLFKTRVTLRQLTPLLLTHHHRFRDPTTQSLSQLLLRSNLLQFKHFQIGAARNLRWSDQLCLHLGSQLATRARSLYSLNYYWMEETLKALSFQVVALT